MLSKKYFYDYEDYAEGNKDAATLAAEILADQELATLEEIIVGCWGESYENGCQPILDMIVNNSGKFKAVRHLFIGDMTYEECEVSWIEQGDYSELWRALPNLQQLTIKGSTGLKLGKIEHAGLKQLEIICGGLPKTIIQSITEAQLPELARLNLYLGVDNYGFDGDITTIASLLDKIQFPNLTDLGIVDSDLEDDIAALVMVSPYLPQLKILRLSGGTLTDKSGQLILEHQQQLAHLQLLDLTYHYLSDAMMTKLKALPLEIKLDDQQEAEEDDGDIWMYPMLTE